MNMLETLVYTLKNFDDLMLERNIQNIDRTRNIAIASVMIKGEPSAFFHARSGESLSVRKGEIYNTKAIESEADKLKVKLSTELNIKNLLPLKRKKPNGGYYEVNIEAMSDKKGQDLFQALSKKTAEKTQIQNDKLIDSMVVFAKQSMLCTERKLLSKIIEYLSLNEETEGTIIMFTILPPCGDCDFLIENFRKKYKNINLSVFDYSQYLNDDIKPEGKVEPEPINVPEIIKTLEDLKSANPNYGLDGYTSIDDVLKNAISLAEELKYQRN